VKKGFRHNDSGNKQKYFCHNCKKWFVEDDGFKRMRHKPKDIVRAVHQYNDGLSLFNVKNHLWQHDAVKVSIWTISKWHKKYELFLKSSA
jgi:transposase-like protein